MTIIEEKNAFYNDLRSAGDAEEVISILEGGGTGGTALHATGGMLHFGVSDWANFQRIASAIRGLRKGPLADSPKVHIEGFDPATRTKDELFISHSGDGIRVLEQMGDSGGVRDI